MKKITKEQIEAILATIYQTNIPAQAFDQIRKLLVELPDCKEEETKKE